MRLLSATGDRPQPLHHRQQGLPGQLPAGLRILDITGIASNSLSEIAYFDIYPASNNTGFNGAWNVYPFAASGTIAISGIEQVWTW